MARKRSYKTGSISRLGRRWRIRWRVEGRQLSETFASLELARRALAGKVGAVETGRAGLPPERERRTLAVLAKEWLRSRRAAGQHRSIDDDESRWRNHLKPEIGHLTPDEVTPAVLRRLIERKLTSGRLRERGKKEDRKKAGEGLSSSTVRLLIRQVSTFFSDLVEDGAATSNPAKSLPKKVRRLIRPAHDPRTTPFLERLEDVRRVFLELPEPVNVAFAIGAMAGLRTGEVRALTWAHVDLERGRIHVRASADGPLKDEESRIVPLQAQLAPVLRSWRMKTGGAGLVVPPLRIRKASSCIDEHTLGAELADALEALKLPRVSWYQATRHTFASHWVMAGGTIEKLRELLGHSTVVVTERYAHLRPDHFGEKDAQRIAVDLSRPAADVVPLRVETELRQPANGRPATRERNKRQSLV